MLVVATKYNSVLAQLLSAYLAKASSKYFGLSHKTILSHKPHCDALTSLSR